MLPTNPESMTTEGRSSEVASILAVALVRDVRSLRSRVSQSLEEVSKSSPEALEDPEDAGLSVSSLGSITASKLDPEDE